MNLSRETWVICCPKRKIVWILQTSEHENANVLSSPLCKSYSGFVTVKSSVDRYGAIWYLTEKSF